MNIQTSLLSDEWKLNTMRSHIDAMADTVVLILSGMHKHEDISIHEELVSPRSATGLYWKLWTYQSMSSSPIEIAVSCFKDDDIMLYCSAQDPRYLFAVRDAYSRLVYEQLKLFLDWIQSLYPEIQSLFPVLLGVMSPMTDRSLCAS